VKNHVGGFDGPLRDFRRHPFSIPSSRRRSFYLNRKRSQVAADLRRVHVQQLRDLLGGPLAKEIRSGKSDSLREAIKKLPPEEFKKVNHPYGPYLSDLINLEFKETEQQFRRGLVALGQKMERNGNFPLAFHWYEQVLNLFPKDPLRSSLEDRLQALRGREVSLGLKLETLTRQFLEGIFDVPTLLSMGVAGMGFRLCRLATFTRLSRGPATLFTRGFGARTVSALAGTLVEAPLFALSGKGLRQVWGIKEYWDPQHLSREIAAGGLLLASLRTFGWAGSQIHRKIHGIQPLTGQVLRFKKVHKISKPLMTQGGMLAGITAAHSLDRTFTLVDPKVPAPGLLENLVTLAQFNVAGFGSKILLGKKISHLEKKLDLQTEALMAKGSLPPLSLEQTGKVFHNYIPSKTSLNIFSNRKIPLGAGLSLGLLLSSVPAEARTLSTQLGKLFTLQSEPSLWGVAGIGLGVSVLLATALGKGRGSRKAKASKTKEGDKNLVAEHIQARILVHQTTKNYLEFLERNPHEVQAYDLRFLEQELKKAIDRPRAPTQSAVLLHELGWVPKKRSRNSILVT